MTLAQAVTQPLEQKPVDLPAEMELRGVGVLAGNRFAVECGTMAKVSGHDLG